MMEYQVGQKVEVIGKDEGFEGSYYGAKVISKEGANQYMVEYDTLLKEDESGSLQEVVAVDLLRPEPPNVANDAFSLEEVVDAYCNDGWWVGLVEGRFGSNYFVQFPHAPGEEIQITIDKLRVHLDWSNGKWKCCSSCKKRMKNNLDYRVVHGHGSSSNNTSSSSHGVRRS